MGKPKATVVDNSLGKKVKYIGLGGKFNKCLCGKTTHKGMVSEFQDKFFCGEDCIREYQRVSA